MFRLAFRRQRHNVMKRIASAVGVPFRARASKLYLGPNALIARLLDQCLGGTYRQSVGIGAEKHVHNQF